MNKTFTYQIDETRLKSRLQAVRIPLSDDAWPWFDLHAGLEKPQPVKRLFTIDFQATLEKLRPHRRTMMMAAGVAGILLVTLTLMAFFSPDRDSKAIVVRSAVAASVSNELKQAMPEAPTVYQNEAIPIRATAIHVATVPAEASLQPAPVVQASPVERKEKKIALAEPQELTPASIEPILMSQLPVTSEPELR